MIRATLTVLRVASRPCRANNLDLSRAADGALPRPVRIGLAIHVFQCRYCRRFLRQLRFLREAGRRFDAAAAARALESTRMPEEVRRRLSRRLGLGT
ncbi:MAG: hypothetical protein WD749_12625 [Phycisphaerales bacterium]